jgi:2-dehydropantoate 2-reductase
MMTQIVEPVGVLGPGAVGGFLAALMWRSGIHVTCIGTESAVQAIERDGITLESATLGSFTARPASCTGLQDRIATLFVTVKAPRLTEALHRVEQAFLTQATVVPLLNGLEHMPILREHLGRIVAAGSIGALEVARESPTRLRHTTKGATIEIASDGDIPNERLDAISDLIASVGLKPTIGASEAALLWGKLVRLSAIALITAASGQSIGNARNDPRWRSALEGAVGEAACVASAEGISMDSIAVMRQIDALPHDLRTSLQRDIEAGRESELEAIAGSVVRAGARLSIPCPVIEHIMEEIRQRTSWFSTRLGHPTPDTRGQTRHG